MSDQPHKAPVRCEPMAERPEDIARKWLADPRTGWSVGTYGAIAEFQYDPGELGLAVDLEALRVVTDRGALFVGPLDHARPFALIDETGRTREIAFCTTRRGAGRTTVESVEPLTYDVGIGAPHIDMLVRLRPDDAETAAALRAATGRPLFAPDNPAGPAIGRASPTRILVSAIARIEVHQPIPAPGGRSPEGPHTHLLPKFLAKGLTRAPGSPLPADLFCGLSLYPRTRL